MRGTTKIAIATGAAGGLLGVGETWAHACATCNVDGGQGQTLMLIFMLSMPVVALVIGVAVIRRLLRRMELS